MKVIAPEARALAGGRRAFHHACAAGMEHAMRISVFLAGAAVLLAASGASAAEGPKLLTTGGKAERASMTAGVSLKETGGVTLITGGMQRAPHETALLGGDAAPEQCELIVKVEHRWRRRIRHLRTQGFYSGIAYPSRGYTQGYYSTGR